MSLNNKIKRGAIASLFFICPIIFAACLSDDGRDVFDLAEKLRSERNYAEALEKYRYITVHHGKSEEAAESFYRIGEISYLYLQDFTAAAAAFHNLLDDYPWSSRCKRAQSYLAEITMYRLEDFKQAIVEYQRAISYYRDEREAERFQFEIAMAYFNLKNFEQQRVELNLLLSRFPGTELKGEVYYQIANSFYVEGFPDEAMKYYEKIIKEFPDTLLSLESTFRLAGCLEEKENLKGAIALLQEIENVYPNGDIVKMRIAKIRKRLKSRRR